MIKFFRKIRQNLLMENKVSKYLAYGLGEIVLVVIGILIALSINNWNQEQLASEKEEKYLDNLERDLENQVISIDIQTSYAKKYRDAAIPLLDQYHSNQELVIDSATSAKFSILTGRKTFVKTDPTYEDLISTGNISLIKNIDLRNALIEYYQELERLEKIIANNNTLLVDEMFGQQIINHIYFGSIPSQKLYDTSNQILSNPDNELAVINLLHYRARIAKLHVENMNELRNNTTEMMELLKRCRK